MKNYETKVYDYVEKDTDIHVVKAVTEYAGKTINAFAKCDPEDVFDIAYGAALAASRLDVKVAQKRYAIARRRAKNYQDMLNWLKAETKRVAKLCRKTETMAGNRKVELAEATAALEELLNEG